MIWLINKTPFCKNIAQQALNTSILELQRSQHNDFLVLYNHISNADAGARLRSNKIISVNSNSNQNTSTQHISFVETPPISAILYEPIFSD